MFQNNLRAGKGASAKNNVSSARVACATVYASVHFKSGNPLARKQCSGATRRAASAIKDRIV